jgi:hypothetical protein
MNGNSPIVKDRLHSKKRKREKGSRIKKEATRQIKSTKKSRKQSASPIPAPKGRRIQVTTIR